MELNFKFLLIIFLFAVEIRGEDTETYAISPKNYDTWVKSYGWKCVKEICVRTRYSENETSLAALDVCKLGCSREGTLWPKPTGKIEISKTTFPFYPQNLKFKSLLGPDEILDLLSEGSKIFESYLPKMHRDYVEGSDSNNFGHGGIPQNNHVEIEVNVVWKERTVKVKGDESYVLSIKKDKDVVSVVIMANTYFGARHALETLSQLIAYDDNLNSLQIVDGAIISDNPVFPYRGLLIDTSRNFIQVGEILKTIEAMSFNKLNVLHWHLTDTHSFPFYSTRLPQMTSFGAYSKNKIYKPEDVKKIVEFGRVRGVKVVPELDGPAHVGNGWEWGKEQNSDFLTCHNAEPWQLYCVEPPCGQLNPLNEKVYDVLGLLFKDFLDVFDNDLVHLGGDEVNMNCWNSSQVLKAQMEKLGMKFNKKDYIHLWSIYQNKTYTKLVEANNGTQIQSILWTSDLTSKKYIEKYVDPSIYTIQIWTKGNDELIGWLVKKGYRVLFSNYDSWYLDCGYGSWIGQGNNWCSPYSGWQKVYANSPMSLLTSSTSEKVAADALKNGLLMGGEVTMWGEQVDGVSLGGKVWPRAAAFGERMWTNPSTSWEAAEVRMIHQRQRLVQRGIHADRLQPEWCHQNEKLCYIDSSIQSPEFKDEEEMEILSSVSSMQDPIETKSNIDKDI